MLGLLALEGSGRAAPPASPPEQLTYLVIYRPGPAWVDGQPGPEQTLKQHFGYMRELYAKGLLKQAGPFADGPGGAVVLAAPDAARAQEIVANDPAVRAKVFSHELRPWRLLPWEQYVQKR